MSGNIFMPGQGGNMYGSIFQNEDYLKKLAGIMQGSEFNVGNNTSVAAGNAGLIKGKDSLAGDGPLTTAARNAGQKMLSGFTDGMFSDKKTADTTAEPKKVSDATGALSDTNPYSVANMSEEQKARIASMVQPNNGSISTAEAVKVDDKGKLKEHVDNFTKSGVLSKDLVDGKNAAFDATKNIASNMTTKSIGQQIKDIDPDSISGVNAIEKNQTAALIAQIIGSMAKA